MRPRSLIPHAPGVAFIAATLGFGVGDVLAKVILDRGVNALELLPIRFLFAVISLMRGAGGHRPARSLST